MQYFTKKYIQFFQELEKNNKKEWFHTNKKRYEQQVRKPMIQFVDDLIQEMQKFDPEMDPVASKCLGRINRDIRFAKDKTPYNTHFFAHVTKGSKENPMAGIAFRFGADHSGIMSGYYNPTKAKLNSIRKKISNDLGTFQSLKSDKKFIAKFNLIQGEAYKRIPPELAKVYEKEPLIANKQFYYVKEKKANFVTSKNLLEEIMDHWLVAKPLNDFFG